MELFDLTSMNANGVTHIADGLNKYNKSSSQTGVTKGVEKD